MNSSSAQTNNTVATANANTDVKVDDDKTKSKNKLPSPKTLMHATKLSISHNKPICFYFYVDSLKGKVCITSDGKEKIIYKNDEEHTSPIVKPYHVDDEYIVVTENTIYIISANTKVEK